MRVLLLQGAVREAIHVELVIQQMDFAVDSVPSVEEARAALAVNRYDLLVADLDTLDENPGAFLRTARPAHAGLRFIVLADRGNIDGVVGALDDGADDFLIKPVDPDELRLRVSGLTARRRDKGATILECGPLRLQVNTGDVSIDGKAVELTPRERAVLQILLRESGNVVSKDYIASRIFSMDDEAAPSAIETYVSRLRRKTADPRIRIRTVRGLGYMLVRAAVSTAAIVAMSWALVRGPLCRMGRCGGDIETLTTAAKTLLALS